MIQIFFKINSIDIKYYLLGLLFTDGNLDKDCTRITLSLTDQDVISQLYPYFCDVKKRKIYKYKPKIGNARQVYTIINTNEDSIYKLTKMGFLPANSTSKPFPKIDILSFPSFLRGVFDGDGSVYISNRYKNINYLGVSITSGSKDFVYGLQKCLLPLGITPHIVIDSRRKEKNNKTYYLRLNSQKEIAKLFNLIYHEPQILMKSKYNKFCNGNIV